MKKCKFENCKTRAHYNVDGQSEALYCGVHKKENMVNVKSKTCIELNCKTIPIFNIEGQKEGLYCNLHKKENMVNVKNKTCIEPDCKTQPIYNIEGQKEALYCSVHKKENMVNVKSKTCIEANCKTIPNYNIEGQKALYCSVHKKENMVDVKNKTCIEPDCKTRPTFNIEGQKEALYCSVHKKENMVNVKHKTCKTHLCSIQVQEKYDGYCYFCFIHMFPDLPTTKNYKTKEKIVAEYITKTFPQCTWITDKKIKDGCSKRRPDLLLDMGEQILIIEIDENQHTDYDCSCENKRLMEISQDLGHRPIIFIRFNPDEYYIRDNKIQSCWGYDKKGLCKLKPKYINEWNERLLVLKQQIEYWSNPLNKTNKTLEVIQLYFDNFEVSKTVTKHKNNYC
jgi:hypothetical protein